MFCIESVQYTEFIFHFGVIQLHFSTVIIDKSTATSTGAVGSLRMREV